MNSSSIDTTFSQTTQNSTPARRRVNVKFAYSFDNDQVLPITQTTHIKAEPCFKVIATEDEVTKHFYQNKSHNISQKHENIEFIKQKTPSEPDSLEDEYSPKLIKEREATHKIIASKNTSSSSIKSILKKSQKKQKETSIPKINQSSISRSSSLLSSKDKKRTSSTRLDFNQVPYLAEVTAKENSCSHPIYLRSLFDQTINIFDLKRSYHIPSDSCRQFRSQRYIKPYRQKANIPTNISKQRSRSLSQQARNTTHSHTFANQYTRPLTGQSIRKQHVSWSPVRENNHQGKDSTIIRAIKRQLSVFIITLNYFSFRKEKCSSTNSSSLLSTRPSRSLIKSCPRTSPSMIPVRVHCQTSRLRQFPSPPSSTNSYYTPTVSEYSFTAVTPISQESYNKKEEKSMPKSNLPGIVYENRKEHDGKMQRYDQLLEKMRATDEQLQSLSRSLTSKTHQKTAVKMDRGSSMSLNKVTTNSNFFSPIMLQMCLIILVIFNLLVVYFFNEINAWWNEYVTPTIIVEQHDKDTLNF